MNVIEKEDQLKAWDEYREFLKLELKKLGNTAEPVFVSKDKVEFEINGKPWKGHAVLAGPKGLISAQKLKKAGVMFKEGTCTPAGKDLALAGLTPKLVKEAEKTFLKLRLGYKIAGEGADGADDADSDANDAGDAAAAAPGSTGAAGGADLAQRAQKIAKAVQVWKKTEEVATKELRKLQKALLAIEDPRTKPVIQGLESILTRIDTIDDEAQAVADAASKGDAAALEKARADFVKKMNGIKSYVEQDELIRHADENPVADVKLRETFKKSLDQLIAAV